MKASSLLAFLCLAWTLGISQKLCAQENCLIPITDYTSLVHMLSAGTISESEADFDGLLSQVDEAFRNDDHDEVLSLLKGLFDRNGSKQYGRYYIQYWHLPMLSSTRNKLDALSRENKLGILDLYMATLFRYYRLISIDKVFNEEIFNADQFASCIERSDWYSARKTLDDIQAFLDERSWQHDYSFHGPFNGMSYNRLGMGDRKHQFEFRRRINYDDFVLSTNYETVSQEELVNMYGESLEQIIRKFEPIVQDGLNRKIFSRNFSSMFARLKEGQFDKAVDLLEDVETYAAKIDALEETRLITEKIRQAAPKLKALHAEILETLASAHDLIDQDNLSEAKAFLDTALVSIADRYMDIFPDSDGFENACHSKLIELVDLHAHLTDLITIADINKQVAKVEQNIAQLRDSQKWIEAQALSSQAAQDLDSLKNKFEREESLELIKQTIGRIDNTYKEIEADIDQHRRELEEACQQLVNSPDKLRALLASNKAYTSTPAFLVYQGLLLENQGKCKEALDLYQQGVDQAEPSCAYRLAQCYRSGTCVEQDMAKSKELLLHSVKLGKADALLDLITDECDAGNAENAARFALEYLDTRGDEAFDELAQVLSLPNAIYQFVELFDEDGQGKYGDERFFEWLQKAADQGDTSALYLLGLCYKQGTRGIPQSNTKAEDCYEKGFALGDPYSGLRLGFTKCTSQKWEELDPYLDLNRYSDSKNWPPHLLKDYHQLCAIRSIHNQQWDKARAALEQSGNIQTDSLQLILTSLVDLAVGKPEEASARIAPLLQNPKHMLVVDGIDYFAKSITNSSETPDPKAGSENDLVPLLSPKPMLFRMLNDLLQGDVDAGSRLMNYLGLYEFFQYQLGELALKQQGMNRKDIQAISDRWLKSRFKTVDRKQLSKELMALVDNKSRLTLEHPILVDNLNSIEPALLKVGTIESWFGGSDLYLLQIASTTSDATFFNGVGFRIASDHGAPIYFFAEKPDNSEGLQDKPTFSAILQVFPDSTSGFLALGSHKTPISLSCNILTGSSQEAALGKDTVCAKFLKNPGLLCVDMGNTADASITINGQPPRPVAEGFANIWLEAGRDQNLIIQSPEKGVFETQVSIQRNQRTRITPIWESPGT